MQYYLRVRFSRTPRIFAAFFLQPSTDHPELEHSRLGDRLITGRIFLRTTSSAAILEHDRTSEAANQFPTTSSEALTTFRSRREALGLSTVELGTLLGVSREQIDMIESAFLSEDVDFLHNLALSLLEMSRSGRRGLHEA